MIRCFVRQGLIGNRVERFDVPARGVTPRALLARFADAMPKSAATIGLAVDGELVADEQLDVELRDGQQVILAPSTGYGIGETLVGILIQIAISAAISYVAYLLTPRPKPPGLPQERGDEGSQSFAWDGMTTNYGPGQPIAWGYGRHAVAGQGIWTDVHVSRTSGNTIADDRLRLILALCEGPIHRFGEILAGSINDLGGILMPPPLGPLPTELRVNGNVVSATASESPGMRVWLRPGTQDQPPLPAPFVGVATTNNLSLQFSLGTNGAGYLFHTIDEAEDLDMIRVVVAFPGGLYEVGPSGTPIFSPAQLAVWWRAPGAPGLGTLIVAPGTAGQFPLHSGGPFVGYHAVTWSAEKSWVGFPTNVTGPIELRIVVATQGVSTTHVTACVLRSVTEIRPHTLRYPRIALLAAEIAAGSRFSGGLPNITLRCDLRTVRVWDATLGWSPRCWDPPAAPFNFTTRPPGRNPAWCLLDFLLAPFGLGRFLTEAKIDLPAFRRWAIFCDQDPDPSDPWGEAQFCVDVIGDVARPAWEWVLLFCSTGRATPVMRNGKISVVYQYRDAHSDGVVSVPAKEPVQLLTSGNCEDVSVEWIPRRERPTVFHFQFLNEDKAYAQDVYPVEDLESTFNDPAAMNREQFRVEVVQAFGITRESQCFREGVWRHRIQSQVRRKIALTTGRWALAGEVGDLFDYQSEQLRPFGDDVSMAMQVLVGADGATSVTVDHHLAGTGLQIVVRNPEGKPERANIDSFVNATVSGKKQSVLTLATPVTCVAGAPCVVGKVDKLTQRYEIIAIDKAKGLKRRVEAIQWTPDAYNPITKDEFEGLLEEGDEPDTDDVGGDVVDAVDVDELPPPVFGIRIATELDGSHSVSWSPPASKNGTVARVYIRPAEMPGVWVLIDSTERTSLPLRGLTAGRSYVVSVCLENRRGDQVPPELGDQLTFTPEEFPPFALPQITNARAAILDEDLLLEWNRFEQKDLDLIEVRCGSNWAAAQFLDGVRGARLVLSNPPAGAPFLLAAKSKSGLYGRITQVANPNWTPPNTVQVLDENDLAPSPAGTHTDTQFASSVIELTTGSLRGTYESLAQDLTTQAPYYWQVRIDREEFEDVTCQELAGVLLGSGEARWRLTTGRPASPAAPGLGWHLRNQDLAGVLVCDLPRDLMATGYRGVVGSHTRVLLESRFYVNGVWTSYAAHVDRVVVASRMQVRLSLGRRALTYRARVKVLTYAAFI